MSRAARSGRAVQEVARLLDIEPLLDRRPSELSGGQRQRVALGRALLREPRAFLMDEPLSNLDAALRVQMRVELKHLHDRLGVTTVYVTHDQVEAMTMGDRIAVMNGGRLQQADTPEAIYVRPANLFVAGFIGSPKMNLVPARVSSANGRVAVDLLGQTVVLEGAVADAVTRVDHGEVVVGLRAEDLRLADDAPASYSSRAQGVVDVWEPLGSETYVVLKVGGPHPHRALPAAYRGRLRRRRRRRVHARAPARVRRAHRAQRARRRPGRASTGRRRPGRGTARLTASPLALTAGLPAAYSHAQWFTR